VLIVKDLHAHYGAIQAIKGVSLQVNDGEIVSLIGANGAGKTTILHTISGLLKATSGRITLNDANLRATDPYKIITLGMAHVPEGRHVFSRMTVMENLRMGAYTLSSKEQFEKNFRKELNLYTIYVPS
jgi:branched-chain amino acid transport system ATP-binding protein